MEQFGQIIERLENKKAVVKLRHHSICGNCGGCGKLFGNPEKDREDIVEVLNPIEAKEGEIVRLESSDSEMLFAAFLLYILPLIGLLAGLFWGRNMAIDAGLAGSPGMWGILIGSLLMIAVFLVLRKLDRRFSSSRRFTAVITGVVDEADFLEESSGEA